jgi:hypothetical protein
LERMSGPMNRWTRYCFTKPPRTKNSYR